MLPTNHHAFAACIPAESHEKRSLDALPTIYVRGIPGGVLLFASFPALLSEREIQRETHQLQSDASYSSLSPLTSSTSWAGLIARMDTGKEDGPSSRHARNRCSWRA